MVPPAGLGGLKAWTGLSSLEGASGLWVPSCEGLAGEAPGESYAKGVIVLKTQTVVDAPLMVIIELGLFLVVSIFSKETHCFQRELCHECGNSSNLCFVFRLSV